MKTHNFLRNKKLVRYVDDVLKPFDEFEKENGIKGTRDDMDLSIFYKVKDYSIDKFNKIVEESRKLTKRRRK